MRSVIGTELAYGGGKLRGHKPKDYLLQLLTTIDTLQCQCLYVHNGAFIFTLHADLTKGLDLIHKHFAPFGLEMHIGREGSPSKTECVCQAWLYKGICRYVGVPESMYDKSR